MMHDYLLVGLSIALVSTLVLYVFRTRGLLESNDYLSEQNIEIMDRALVAEREATAAKTELAFLRNTVVTILQRPGTVVITDEQFGILTNTVSAVVQTIIKPNSLN